MKDRKAMEFFVAVSMSDLLLWEGDQDVPSVHRSFAAALFELGLTVDIP